MLLASVSNYIIRLNNQNIVYYNMSKNVRGITQYQDKIYIAIRSSVTNLISYNLLVLDKLFNILETTNLPITMLDVHEIVVYNNKLWIMSTGDDKVVKYDLNTKQWEEWYPLGKPSLIQNTNKFMGFDHHHFNSIYFNDNKIYILAHNLNFDNSKIYVFNMNYKLIDEMYLGRHAHNIWKKDNEILINDSENHRILGTNGFEFKVPDNGAFLRGITFDKNNIYIGSSQFESKEKRLISYSTIYKFDLNYKLIDEIKLDVPGQIFSLSYADDEN